MQQKPGLVHPSLRSEKSCGKLCIAVVDQLFYNLLDTQHLCLSYTCSSMVRISRPSLPAKPHSCIGVASTRYPQFEGTAREIIIQQVLRL